MHPPLSWQTHPVKWFDEFVASTDFVLTAHRRRAPELETKPISQSSAAPYRFMFRSFAGWMASQDKHLATIGQQDLLDFIHRTGADGQRILNSRIALRYLRLLERCYHHLQLATNPAQQVLLRLDRNSEPGDAPTTALSAEQLQRFREALPAGLPGRRRGTVTGGWKQRRDRALLAVMLFGGLKVAEAIGLQLDEVGRQIHTDGSMRLRLTPACKHATSHEHTTVLHREGVAELDAWLAERARMNIPGALVFPASRDGTRALHKASVYRQARATFERAGIATTRAGGRTLRNTYAVQLLGAGTPAGEVQQYLGLADERSARAYEHAHVGQGHDA